MISTSRDALGWLAALAVVGALLAGCGSTESAPPGDFTDSDTYRSGPYEPGEATTPRPSSSSGPSSTGSDGAGEGTVVSVSAEEHAKLRAFVNRRSTLLADTVEVDMSRKPFLSATTFTVSRDAVDRTEQVDGARGVTTITLTNKSGIRTSLHALPKVRVGDGLDIVAIDRLVIRYWTKQDVRRPIHLRAVGAGNAAYLIEGPPAERHKGSRVTLNADVSRAGSGYRFADSIDTQP